MGAHCAPLRKKNPLPFPFSERSHVGNLRQTIQGKGVIHKRVETAGVYPLIAPARRQRTFPRSAERNSPLRFSEKLSARQGRTRLRQFASPTQTVLKTPARQGRTRLRQFASPAQPVLKKTAARQRRTRLRQFVYPAQPAQKPKAAPFSECCSELRMLTRS